MFTKGSFLEKLIYEVRPYLYLTIGGSAALTGVLSFYSEPFLAGILVLCGLLLASAAFIIIKMRLIYRQSLHYHMNFSETGFKDRRRNARRSSSGLERRWRINQQ